MRQKIYLGNLRSERQKRKLKPNIISGSITSSEVILPDYFLMDSLDYLETLRLVKQNHLSVYLTGEKDNSGKYHYKILIKDKLNHVFSMNFIAFNSMFMIAQYRIKYYLAKKLKRRFERFLSIKPDFKSDQKI